MKIFETLLENYWILKSDDEELYYKIKDNLGKLNEIVKQKLGWKIIQNDKLIKLEKLPSIPSEFMGIETFTDKLDYILFMLVLLFLEEKIAGEQFVLSQLIDFIQTNFFDIDHGDISIDFTLYSNRKSMVRVLQYVSNMSFIKAFDGDEQRFAQDRDAEVLYNVTGISKYFVRNFSTNISSCKNYSDILQSEELGLEQDVGARRRQRVYKRLFTEAVIYNTPSNEQDYLYVKNYRNIIAQDIEKYLDSQFAVHKNGAYILLDMSKNFKDTHPSNKIISDIVLLVCNKLREEFKNTNIERRKDDIIEITSTKLSTYIIDTKELCKNGFTKEYKEMTDENFVNTVILYMKKYGMIRYNSDTLEYELLPMFARITGKYPKEFFEFVEE